MPLEKEQATNKKNDFDDKENSSNASFFYVPKAKEHKEAEHIVGVAQTTLANLKDLRARLGFSSSN